MGKWVRSEAYRAAIRAIVEARTSRGLTQRDIAERMGKKHHTFLAKIEAGERRIDLIEFIAIARAIGVPEDELLRVIGRGLPERLDI